MFYLPKSLKLLNKFGRLPMSGSDFIELSHANDIELVFSADVQNGFYYYTPQGQHTIVVATRLQSSTRKWVSWHEFAHYLQNRANPVTTADFCNIGEQTAKEKMADAFATICTEPNLRLCRPMDFLEMLINRVAL